MALCIRRLERRTAKQADRGGPRHRRLSTGSPSIGRLTIRLRQKFPRLRAGQRGHPPRPYCPLPAHAEVIGRPGPRAGRRPLRPHALSDRARRRPRARRLLAGSGPRRGLQGPLGGRGGPLRAALDGRRQPAAGRQVAPLDGRPHVGRAVLDRVCQTAHRITLKGASMRKRQPGSEEANNA